LAYRLAHRWRLRLRWVCHAATVAALVVGSVAGAIQPATAVRPQPDPAPPVSPTTKTTGPNAGAVPTTAGSLTFPATHAPITPAPSEVIGPFVTEIINASTATERLGEQLKALNAELTAAQAATAQFRATYEPTAARFAEIKAKAAEILADVYKGAAALGPFQDYADELQDFGLVAPALSSQLGQSGRPEGRDGIGDQLVQAEAAELAASSDLNAAIDAEAEVANRRAIVAEQFRLRQAALTTLNTRNAALTGQARAARDAYEDSRTASRGLGTSVNGLQAAPSAVTAVNFALKQLGKVYEWAAEGPNTYDCSGLMYASYRQIGLNLPRVSRYQYGAGTPVLVSQLLPGDLLFFSTDRSDWRHIHHVAMYLGGGKMIHAPTFGERVKISPVWWSEYFGATRVVPAVAGRTTSHTQTHPTIPTPSPTGAATPSTEQTPTATASPTAPTGTPTRKAAPTPTATATPTQTATPTSSTPEAEATATETATPTAGSLATTLPPSTTTARRVARRRRQRLPWQDRRGHAG
jgi:cell wall-associated NlpC family hydrolase